jgi:hypothetical protein
VEFNCSSCFRLEEHGPVVVVFREGWPSSLESNFLQGLGRALQPIFRYQQIKVADHPQALRRIKPFDEMGRAFQQYRLDIDYVERCRDPRQFFEQLLIALAIEHQDSVEMSAHISGKKRISPQTPCERRRDIM